MKFFTALKFLTIFPAPSKVQGSPEQLGRSIAYFPVVGLIIGIVLGGAAYLLRFILPTPVIGALMVTGLVIMTGAHHLDGLMDTCDGMVAGRTREQRLEIMSDTRVGAFGIAGACLVLLLKYSVFSSTSGMATLLLFTAVSRWALTGAILIFPSAKNSGSGYAVKQSSDLAGFITASLITLVACILLAGLVQGPLLMIGIMGLVCILGAILTSIYGGLTGDSYGAIVEIGEVMALLLIIVLNYFKYLMPGNALIVFP
jgi:adenosylcobinamide-GDP ribazoletransferase